MTITFIGSGNVAWHLSQALQQTGHSVTGIFSRNTATADALVQQLPQATRLPSLYLTDTHTDVVLIAVPDAALPQVAQELQVQPGTLVAHTSGSQPLHMLQTIAGARVGVFYPLQTFSKSKPLDLEQVPILVEATEQDTLQQLQQLAHSLTDKVHTAASGTRRQLHLAAVFACNFTNHLLGISQQLLQEASLTNELLQPLIQETIAKAMQQHPYSVQTGPAIRHDQIVIDTHLQMLQQHPHLQELYHLLTQSIQRTGTAE